jgi:hypothetical protein
MSAFLVRRDAVIEQLVEAARKDASLREAIALRSQDLSKETRDLIVASACLERPGFKR